MEMVSTLVSGSLIFSPCAFLSIYSFSISEQRAKSFRSILVFITLTSIIGYTAHLLAAVPAANIAIYFMHLLAELWSCHVVNIFLIRKNHGEIYKNVANILTYFASIFLAMVFFAPAWKHPLIQYASSYAGTIIICACLLNLISAFHYQLKFKRVNTYSDHPFLKTWFIYSLFVINLGDLIYVFYPYSAIAGCWFWIKSAGIVQLIYYNLVYIFKINSSDVVHPQSDTELLSEEKLSGLKYQKSGLTKEKSQKSWEKIVAAFEIDQIFLDPELDLSKISDQINLSPHLISQVINENSGKKFYELVCGYRISRAMNELADPRNSERKLIDIAWSCGFTSHSNFFRRFKTITGMTPSQYKDKYISLASSAEKIAAQKSSPLHI